jgi:hypothetical protein
MNLNRFHLDDPAKAIAPSTRQTGPRGVSMMRRGTRREGRHDVNSAGFAPAENPSRRYPIRNSSIIIRGILSTQPGSPLWS